MWAIVLVHGNASSVLTTGFGAPWPSPHRRALHHFVAEQFEPVDISRRAFAVADLFEDVENAAGAHTAGRAFAAGFFLREFHEEAGDIHHAGLVVHDDQAAGAHHRAGRGQGFVIERQVEMLFHETAAHRSTGLNGFELLAVLDAAADVEDHFAQGNAEWALRSVRC
ncbi:MAG: hypothetical protein MZV64_62805 [Ignavibacteriales bacterium]|nr:hypothetical protein [Ignavibacteriales bacterium]